MGETLYDDCNSDDYDQEPHKYTKVINKLKTQEKND